MLCNIEAWEQHSGPAQCLFSVSSSSSSDWMCCKEEIRIDEERILWKWWHTGNKVDLMEVYSYISQLSPCTSDTPLFMRGKEHTSCCPQPHTVTAILWIHTHHSLTWMDFTHYCLIWSINCGFTFPPNREVSLNYIYILRNDIFFPH